MMKTFSSERRGFTLIELLVVIAIIGILSSVVLASLSTARSKSRDARRIADIDQVRTALELYNDSNSAYPNTGAAGTAAQTFTAATAVGVGLVTPTFMSKLPSDPTNGRSYYYCPWSTASAANTCDGTGASASSTSYVLGANLEKFDNSALKTDSDKVFTGVFVGGPNDTTSSATGDCVGGPLGYCYDITN